MKTKVSIILSTFFAFIFILAINANVFAAEKEWTFMV